MTKLNQIIAVANGKKTKTQEILTEIYKKVQKPELFQGLSRTYRPLDENGETKPPESKVMQSSVNEAITEFSNSIADLMDVVYTQDEANCLARADVVVDGRTVAQNVPVTHLLFMEKQLVDIRTFISKLPVLDPSENWSFDQNRACYVTPTTFTNATKKILRAFEKSPATNSHPAQVETYSEDVKVGEWDLVKFSTAMPVKTKKEIAERVEKLIEAVKFAREQANSSEIEQKKIGKNIISFIFG